MAWCMKPFAYIKAWKGAAKIIKAEYKLERVCVVASVFLTRDIERKSVSN